MSKKRPECLQSHALNVPWVQILKGKRVVLASASPRRREILEIFGLNPEIVPSTFEENLGLSQFDDLHEYPVATANFKAVEVYRRLVEQDPEDPPDLVIAADTVVLTYPQPILSSTPDSELLGFRPDVLEKPVSRDDNLRMLLDLNGNRCEVVTGVSIVYPVLESPGYKIHSMDDRTLVTFSDNPVSLLNAYADSGEGIDRAGGFAVQGLGGMLVRKIEGDFRNVVGFPAAAFFKTLEILLEEEPDFLTI
ncbi:Maf Ham1 [Thelephora terrestris]|uniref:Maf Ham1 n=1 Tax=Thelephora terrestris TaxID=56493 RepID=A0A9P6LAL3_9AGAM|nr:Maf Ham1 [Thelephora terrestris]